MFRTDYRAAARSALSARPRFASIPMLRSWSGHVDDQSLPVMGVVTASEKISPGSSGQFGRETMLQVALKRRGGETIEDDLDLDAAEIEATVFAALYSRETPCFPAEVSFAINGEGAKRTGTVVVTFRINSWRSAP